ncbi:BMP family ABC transporter substrate-binding protein, partial [Thermus scotoductus]|uniref:BMP family ABC transporter substrate-binding protein n=1 Tax=Thermus scotoductus TaxID=37636 RepID=UPI0020A4A86F
IPLIHKFEAGFRPGTEYAFYQYKIPGTALVGYIVNTPAAWNDTAKAKEIAASQVRQGADIIYAAAGGSGLGIIDYVKQAKCLEEGGAIRFVSKADPHAKVPKYRDYTKARGTDGTKATTLFYNGVDENKK